MTGAVSAKGCFQSRVQSPAAAVSMLMNQKSAWYLASNACGASTPGGTTCWVRSRIKCQLQVLGCQQLQQQSVSRSSGGNHHRLLSAEAASQNAGRERRQNRSEMTTICPTAGILMRAALVHQVSNPPLKPVLQFSCETLQQCCSVAGRLGGSWVAGHELVGTQGCAQPCMFVSTLFVRVVQTLQAQPGPVMPCTTPLLLYHDLKA